MPPRSTGLYEEATEGSGSTSRRSPRSLERRNHNSAQNHTLGQQEHNQRRDSGDDQRRHDHRDRMVLLKFVESRPQQARVFSAVAVRSVVSCLLSFLLSTLSCSIAAFSGNRGDRIAMLRNPSSVAERQIRLRLIPLSLCSIGVAGRQLNFSSLRRQPSKPI